MKASTSVLMLGFALIISKEVSAVTIGSGPAVSAIGEGPGTRINVDLNVPVVLPAGTYAASSFNTYIAQGGDVIPFLATVKSGATGNGSATDNFTVIASGLTRNITNTGSQNFTFGGAPIIFTLSAPTQVFAGITNNGAGPIPVGITLGSGSTDHNNPGFTPSVGSDTGTFTNFGLNRTYSFDVSVNTLSTPFAVGPGPVLGQNLLADGSGTRTNVDLLSAPTLPAGTYKAVGFDVAAVQSGNVTPFVAIPKPGATSNGTGTDNFTVIASGTNRNIASANTYNFAFGGSDTFTLTVPTQIFVGITNDPGLANPNQPVGYNDGLSVDHNNPGFAALVGSDTGTFTNPGLGRHYAFDIQLQLVPEPSSAILAGGAFAVLIGIVNRRRGKV